MGERKTSQTYIPPDFDHSLLPRLKKVKDFMQEIRTMIPFSMRCSTCSEYMYRGKKFNAKKEILDEHYMGTKIIRFYLKCAVCSAAITFKTDPKTADYVCESGAVRNFEVWKDTAEAEAEVAKEREAEDDQDAMKKLENKTLDNKIEMDMLDALDEMRAINQRHEKVDTKSLLASLSSSSSSSAATASVALGANGLTEEEEALVKSIRFKRSGEGIVDSDSENEALGGSGSSSSSSSSGSSRVDTSALLAFSQQQASQQPHKPLEAVVPVTVIVRKKRKVDDASTKETDPHVAATTTSSSSSSTTTTSSVAPSTAAVAAPVKSTTGLGCLLAAYDDSDEEE